MPDIVTVASVSLDVAKRYQAFLSKITTWLAFLTLALIGLGSLILSTSFKLGDIRIEAAVSHDAAQWIAAGAGGVASAVGAWLSYRTLSLGRREHELRSALQSHERMMAMDARARDTHRGTADAREELEKAVRALEVAIPGRLRNRAQLEE
jgi:hypothetical protein